MRLSAAGATAAAVLEQMRGRQEAAFFASLHKAVLRLGVARWCLVVVRSVLPALFAVAMGAVVGALQSGPSGSLTPALTAMGVVFVLLQVVTPVHQAVGENLGNRLSAWLATHWLLRESTIWADRDTAEVREATKHADYAYRIAVDPPSAKELRMFGLADWTVERFSARRMRLYELQAAATRLRERPVAICLALVALATSPCSPSWRARPRRGRCP